MSLKVTVAVPTYNSGSLIGPLIDAMRAQTLPAAEFEVLFVDDGSTDGTADRLEELAAREGLFRVIRSENSGWPGRPRNVAIGEARGEYVHFVDHDDSLGREALERMYAMGARNRSDIVIGKVTITHRLRGAPQALMSRNRESVTYRTAALHDSLTVHKMYRTAFLREQRILFPVGPYVGEDLLFMVPAVFRAASVSVVGDYPCYYYLEREDGGHATPDRLDPASYARNLREILEALLAETEPGPVRDTWLRRFWRADVVKYLSEPLFPSCSDDAYREELLLALRSVARDYLTEGACRGLLGLERTRSALVQAGATAELTELTVRASGLSARVVLTSAYWHRDRLRLAFDASFTCGPDAAPLTVEQHGDRLLLQPSLTAGLGVEPVDVTDDLERFRVDVFLRHRDTAVKWMLPRDLDVAWEPVPGGIEEGGPVLLRPVIHATASVDPLRAASGHPPEAGVWDVDVRVLGPGLDRSTDLRAGPGPGTGVPAGRVGGLRVGCVEPGRPDAVLSLTVEASEPPLDARRDPLVSVVLPVGDDPGALAASLASLAAQVWEPGAHEVVLVGGEDEPGGRALPPGVRRVPAGGSDPRDAGVAAARGAYVFFLKAGDRLGEEALQRMSSYGLEHDADIVAGRLGAGPGRPVPKVLYSADRPSATFARDPLADSLTAEKLFDRSMVLRHGLRFGAGHPLAEQAFTSEALLRARRTAVLGSYVCVSYGAAATPAPFEPRAYYSGLRAVLATTERLTEPGAVRDRLHRRWLRLEILGRLDGRRLLHLDDDERDTLLQEIRATLDGPVSATALAGLQPRQRLTAELVTGGRTEELLELLRWERSLACQPLLGSVRRLDDGSFTVRVGARLAAEGRPVELVAGEDRISPLSLSDTLRDRLSEDPLTAAARPEAARAVLVLRERATGARHDLDTACETVREAAGHGRETLLVTGTARFDPATVVSGKPLGDGVWDFHVRIAALGHNATARLGARRLPGFDATLPARPHPDGDGRTVAPYWTVPRGDLSLRVGRPHQEGAGRAHRSRLSRALGALRRGR